MGLYKYIDAQDRVKHRQVSDKELNTVFQEALLYYPLLMIEEIPNGKIIKNGWFKKIVIPQYNIYHETPALDGTPYQACLIMVAGGNKENVYAYLFGVINGALSQKNILT